MDGVSILSSLPLLKFILIHFRYKREIDAFMLAVTACMGTWSTLACNIGDFSRYSKKETSAVYQLAFIPILWSIMSLFGAISSNCLFVVYGEVLWQVSASNFE